MTRPHTCLGPGQWRSRSRCPGVTRLCNYRRDCCVFLTKDVCVSGTISTLRFSAPGRLRAVDIIEPENRHSQTPQGTCRLNMTLTSQESSRTGFTHHHIIDIARPQRHDKPPRTSYCLAGPTGPGSDIHPSLSLVLKGEGDFL